MTFCSTVAMSIELAIARGGEAKPLERPMEKAGRQSRWSGRWTSRGPPATSLVLLQDGVAGSSTTYKILLMSC